MFLELNLFPLHLGMSLHEELHFHPDQTKFYYLLWPLSWYLRYKSNSDHSEVHVFYHWEQQPYRIEIPHHDQLEHVQGLISIDLLDHYRDYYNLLRLYRTLEAD